MTDLDALIAAVEAGDEEAAAEICRCLHRDAHDVGKTWPGFDAIKAYRGSLDAAKRLHDAMLPGWWVQISGPTAGGEWMVNFAGYDSAFAKDPARAWLLAILRPVNAYPSTPGATGA